MFGSNETESVGMRAMVTCAVCDSPIAGVDTIGDRASTETDLGSCPDHPLRGGGPTLKECRASDAQSEAQASRVGRKPTTSLLTHTQSQP